MSHILRSELLQTVIDRIERGEQTPQLVDAIHDLAPEPKVIQPSNYLRSMDAALGLLPEGADWRRLTPISCAVYASSPYNANAQVRYDGNGPTPAAQLCAAIFRMQLAKVKKLGAAA